MQEFGSPLINSFPKIKLSYETFVHKKVDDADIIVALPDGKRCFIWFYEGVCHLIEILREQKVKVVRSESFSFCKDCEGCIFYGVLFKETFFATEDIIYNKGKSLHFMKYPDKLKQLDYFFKKYFNQAHLQNKSLLLGLPLIFSGKEYSEDPSILENFPYKVGSFQYRYFQKPIIYKLHVRNEQSKIIKDSPVVLNKQNNSITRFNSKQGYTNIKQVRKFKVIPDLQNDIYHLYNLENNSFFDVAYIPDYKTSVMMNKLFRTIKENENLDALEESDSEEEFENDKIDKFVNLNMQKVMNCEFNQKFKKWVPV